MAISNLLVKTLGGSGTSPKKFLLQLDAAVRHQIHAFQIMPCGTYSADSGWAEDDPLVDPNDATKHWVGGSGASADPNVFHAARGPRGAEDTSFDLFGLVGPSLYVGAQGTGLIWDNPLGTDELLLWKVISIAGPAPDGWQSMDIYQDLPAPPGNTAVA